MKHLTRVFRALADPTRREILHKLKEGELSAGAIVSYFDMSGPAVSRHLSILMAADLVQQRRERNSLYYSLEAETLSVAMNEFLSSVCPTQIITRKKLNKAKKKKRKSKK